MSGAPALNGDGHMVAGRDAWVLSEFSNSTLVPVCCRGHMASEHNDFLDTLAADFSNPDEFKLREVDE